MALHHYLLSTIYSSAYEKSLAHFFFLSVTKGLETDKGLDVEDHIDLSKAVLSPRRTIGTIQPLSGAFQMPPKGVYINKI